MKNTKSEKVQFGHKVSMHMSKYVDYGTVVTTTHQELVKASIGHPVKISAQTVNFSDKRRQEAYKRINEKLGEG